jgi:hypothetical protein
VGVHNSYPSATTGQRKAAALHIAAARGTLVLQPDNYKACMIIPAILRLHCLLDDQPALQALQVALRDCWRVQASLIESNPRADADTH